MNDKVQTPARSSLDTGAQDTIRAVLDLFRGRGLKAIARAGVQRSWQLTVSGGEIDALSSSTTRGVEFEILDNEGRRASISSNRFGGDELMRLAEDGIALVEAGEPDAWRSLAPLEDCGAADVSGLEDVIHEGFEARAEALRGQLLEADAQVRAADPRIETSHRASASQRRISSYLWTTEGLELSRYGSSHSLVLNAVARDGDEKQTGYQWTSARDFQQLKPIDELAKECVQRTLRGFGWQQVASGPVRALFDPDMAAQLIGVVASLVRGREVYSKSSFWADKAGDQVASPLLSIVDDPLIAGGLGSRPYDSQGVRSRVTEVLQQGKLVSFLTDDYAARRLELPRTGSAGGPSNFVVEPGDKTPEQMFEALGTGLWVTGLHGHGVDIAAGTWSMGAVGFWVVDGALAHPVQEITLAGKLDEMFRGIEAIGQDAREDGSVRAPSLLVGTGLVLGGQ